MASYTLSENEKLQFTGHETFPLRQLWLSKTAMLIRTAREDGSVPSMSGEKAMEELGVGKNMVGSMRFWAEACGMIDANLSMTPCGRLILGDAGVAGLDESCSNVASQWFVHWRLASVPGAFTPVWYLFNLVTFPTVERENLCQSAMDFVRASGRKISAGSIKRGIDVALRSYAPRMTGRGYTEDFIEPFLSELDLVDVLSRDAVALHCGKHPTLPDSLFAFALLEYWERMPYQASSLDFARVANDYGSPGRVFKLSHGALEDRLERLSEITDEALVWTEQLGLRQVIRRGEALQDSEAFKMKLLRRSFETQPGRAS